MRFHRLKKYLAVISLAILALNSMTCDTTSDSESKPTTDQQKDDGSPTPDDYTGDEETIGCENGPEKSVLFIGNSYTSYNNLAQIVTDLACSLGIRLNATTRTAGGARFASHVSDSETLAAIENYEWDAVILQNQSQVPGWKSADVTTLSLPHAESLVTAIHNNSSATKIVYYATWGRQNGDATNCSYNPIVCTFAGHSTALSSGYQIYVDSTGGTIAPVGSVWQSIVEDDEAPFSGDILYHADGSHPSLHGSFLAALTLTSKLFGAPGFLQPDGLTITDATYIHEQVVELLGLDGSTTYTTSSTFSFNTNCGGGGSWQPSFPTGYSDCHDYIDGKDAYFLLLDTTCNDWYLSGAYFSGINSNRSLVYFTTQAQCKSESCSSAGGNVWFSAKTGFNGFSESEYTTYIYIDMNDNGVADSGDAELCRNNIAIDGDDQVLGNWYDYYPN